MWLFLLAIHVLYYIIGSKIIVEFSSFSDVQALYWILTSLTFIVLFSYQARSPLNLLHDYTISDLLTWLFNFYTFFACCVIECPTIFLKMYIRLHTDKRQTAPFCLKYQKCFIFKLFKPYHLHNLYFSIQTGIIYLSKPYYFFSRCIKLLQFLYILMY